MTKFFESVILVPKAPGLLSWVSRSGEVVASQPKHLNLEDCLSLSPLPIQTMAYSNYGNTDIHSSLNCWAEINLFDKLWFSSYQRKPP